MPNVRNWLSKASQRKTASAADAWKRGALRGRQWLADTNPYAINPVAALAADAQQGNNAAASAALCEFTIPSMISHCIDGWSLLSCSVSSFLRGDAATALHLAYYAELRSAFSLLAAHGIVILDDTHACIDEAGRQHLWSQERTHDIVWQCLENWGVWSRFDTFLLDSVSVRSRSIKEWFESAALAVQASLVVCQLLQRWGLDIKLFSQDRDVRNWVSYRATRVTPLPRTRPRREVGLISSFWGALEPAGGCSLSIDRELLRVAIEVAVPDADKRAETVDLMMQQDHLQDSASEFGQFLKRAKGRRDHPLVQHAAQPSNPFDGHQSSITTIARATLLLRLASAAVAKHLSVAGIDRRDVSFWVNPLGWDCGLWSQELPQNLSDLWAPIEGALSRKFEERFVADSWENNSRDLTYLSQLQRAGLWSLGV